LYIRDEVEEFYVTSIEQFDLERFWSTEELIVDTPEVVKKRVDSLAVYLETGLGQQYVTRFPWKPNHSELKTNFFICE